MTLQLVLDLQSFIQQPFKIVMVLNKGSYDQHLKLRPLQHPYNHVMKMWGLGIHPHLQRQVYCNSVTCLSLPASQPPIWPTNTCKTAVVLEASACSPPHYIQKACLLLAPCTTRLGRPQLIIECTSICKLLPLWVFCAAVDRCAQHIAR